MLNIYSYSEFTAEKLQTLLQMPATLIYDVKPSLIEHFDSVLDLNTFRILCFQNLIQSNLKNQTVFHLKKVSDDILHLICKLNNSNSLFFTDETNLRAVDKQVLSHRVEIVYFPAKKPEKTVMGLLVHYQEFEIFKINFTKKLTNFAVYSKNPLIFKNFNLINAENIVRNDRCKYTCVLFDANYTLCNFAKYIYFFSNTEKCVFNATEITQAFKVFSGRNELLDQDYFCYCLRNESHLSSVLRWVNIKKDTINPNKMTEVKIGVATFPSGFSRFLFEFICKELKSKLEKCMLFLKAIKGDFQNLSSGIWGKQFKCVLSIPVLFDLEAESNAFLSKKEAVNDACYKYMKKLFVAEILDEHLQVNIKTLINIPTVQNLFIRAYNTLDLESINKMGENDEDPVARFSNIIEKSNRVYISYMNDTGNKGFKKSNMLDLDAIKSEECVNTPDSNEVNPMELVCPNMKVYFYPITPKERLEKSYRKIPQAFSSPSDILALYTFGNSSTGILCHQILNESLIARGRHIQYCGSVSYTKKQLKLLKFYQVMFFKHSTEIFNLTEQAFQLHYFVAPVKDSTVDFPALEAIYDNFLTESVLNFPSSEYLIWNPFSRDFLLYHSPFNMNLEHNIEGVSFLDYFQGKYQIEFQNKSGMHMFRALLTDQAMSLARKQHNIHQESHTKATFTKEELISKLTETTLTNPRDTNRQPLGPTTESGFAAQTFSQAECLYILPTESCFVTALKTSLLDEIHLFKRNFFDLETSLIAHELIQAFDLKTSVGVIVECLTQSSENPLFNYERLEFLGDCFLKFYTTCHLYRCSIPMNEIVASKDLIICNSNLFKCCISSGLFRYISISHFAPKMVQAPYLSNMGDITEYFNATKIFKSDNLNFNASKSFESSQGAKKLYSDVVEAIIGAVYLEVGIQDAVGFLNHLKLFPSEVSYTVNPLSYYGILTGSDINCIEDLIGYVFTNKGNLEKALVHPSFSVPWTSQYFQHLELLGDCALDLFVSSNLFNLDLPSPLHMHCAKICYVNNSVLNGVIKYSGLCNYAKFKIKGESKAFPDLMEALLGGILIDLNFDFNEFTNVMNRKIVHWFEKCKDLNNNSIEKLAL